MVSILVEVGERVGGKDEQSGKRRNRWGGEKIVRGTNR